MSYYYEMVFLHKYTITQKLEKLEINLVTKFITVKQNVFMLNAVNMQMLENS